MTQYTYLIDSHLHLHDSAFSEDYQQVIQRAIQSKIGHLLIITCRFEESSKTLELARKYDFISSSIGVHPHYAKQEIEHVSVERLIEYTHHKKIIGIGETGLDYYYENSPKQEQITSFHIHIEAARQTGLPLIIHSRSADEDMANILEKEMLKGKFKPLMHCFSSTEKLADQVMELDGYFSFSGILTFKNSELLRSIAQKIPKERILIETDSPYLAPIPYRGKRNEPAFLIKTAEKLAKIKNWSLEETIHITTQNFYQLFNKAISS